MESFIPMSLGLVPAVFYVAPKPNPCREVALVLLDTLPVPAPIPVLDVLLSLLEALTLVRSSPFLCVLYAVLVVPPRVDFIPIALVWEVLVEAPVCDSLDLSWEVLSLFDICPVVGVLLRYLGVA